MLTVKNIMTRDLITLSPDTEIAHAANLLLEEGINGIPVVDKRGELVGIICQSQKQDDLRIPGGRFS